MNNHKVTLSGFRCLIPIQYLFNRYGNSVSGSWKQFSYLMALKLVTCTVLLKALCGAVCWLEPQPALFLAKLSPHFCRARRVKVKINHVSPSSLLGWTYLPHLGAVYLCYILNTSRTGKKFEQVRVGMIRANWEKDREKEM